MNEFDESPIVVESLELAFVTPWRVRLSGTLTTSTAQDEIERILWRVHSHILNRNIAAFTVDVRDLNFVNSSAIRVFINWTSRAERALYKLVFITDPTVTWHRLNFAALRSMAPGSVEIRSGHEGSGDG
jgi:hypothetical protein